MLRAALFLLISLSLPCQVQAEASLCKEFQPSPEQMKESQLFQNRLDAAPMPSSPKLCEFIYPRHISGPKPSLGTISSVPLVLKNSTHEFQYALHKGTAAPPRKTVVYLGGGPGVEWIRNGRPHSIPPEIDVIVVDYPGVGRNLPKSDKVNPDELYSSETAGRFIAGIVEKEKLSNYAILGHSYGTVVATVAASELSKTARKPTAVILESGAGRTYQDQAGKPHELEAHQSAISDRLFEKLSAEEKAKFAALAKAIDENAPGQSLAFRTFTGAIQGENQASALRALRVLVQASLQEIMSCHKQAQQKNGQGGPGPGYQVSSCEFIQARQPSPGVKLFHGIIEGQAGGAFHFCGCTNSKIKGTYDSKLHQIEGGVPVFYINGTEDNLNPLWQTRYNFENQKTRNKSITVIQGGGHHILVSGAYPPSCHAQVWQSLFKGQAKDLNQDFHCETARSPEELEGATLTSPAY